MAASCLLGKTDKRLAAARRDVTASPERKDNYLLKGRWSRAERVRWGKKNGQALSDGQFPLPPWRSLMDVDWFNEPLQTNPIHGHIFYSHIRRFR